MGETARPRLVVTTPKATVLRRQLAARRRELGLSQVDVDDQLGCAERLVSKWECGLRNPGLGFLIAWCDALDLDIVLVPKR